MASPCRMQININSGEIMVLKEYIRENLDNSDGVVDELIRYLEEGHSSFYIAQKTKFPRKYIKTLQKAFKAEYGVSSFLGL